MGFLRNSEVLILLVESFDVVGRKADVPDCQIKLDFSALLTFTRRFTKESDIVFGVAIILSFWTMTSLGLVLSGYTFIERVIDHMFIS